jgi:hypothetical protein
MNQPMTPPRNYMNPEGPTFLFQQTCPRRSTGSAPAAIAAVRQVAISTPVHGITSRGTRLTESRREQDQRRREGRRKGLHVTTSYRKEKRNIPRMEGGKEQREGDFHLPSTRLTVLRCLHRVSGRVVGEKQESEQEDFFCLWLPPES